MGGLGIDDDSAIDDQSQSDLAGAAIDETASPVNASAADPDPDPAASTSEDSMSEDVMSDDAMSEDSMSDEDDEMFDNSLAEEAAAEDEAAIDPAAAERQLSTDPNIAYAVGSCHIARTPGSTPSEVACTEPHTIEVYGSEKLPGAAGAPFAGRERAVTLCNDLFLSTTGVAIDLATVFERSVLRPSEETWLAGERTVTCYVAYPAPTTEPLANIDPLRSFGKVSLYGLRRGDCLIDFDDSQSSFNLVDCSEPHDAEVFAELVLGVDAYPGDDEVAAAADELCFGQNFEDFVGTPHATSVIRSLRSKPSSETWALGDRTINCLLTDGLVRTDSFAGSEL